MIAKLLDNPAETVFVGGPMQFPTPSFPVRPAPCGVKANAFMLNQPFGPGFGRLQFPIWSGLTSTAR